MALLTRAGIDTLIATNLPDNTTASIDPAEHREVEYDLADSVVWVGEAEIRVINMTTTSPPGSPADRDAYVVASGATGAWNGEDDNIAVRDADASAWVFYTPADGQAVWNVADDTQYRWDGAAWVAPAPASHAHAASDITSGTFADARVAASNVTQHQAALSIGATQLTGTLADARVAQSNVTQHQAALSIATSQLTGKATAADIRGGVADKFITADGIEAAAVLVTLTDAATVAVDWSTFLVGSVTLGGNRTLGAPSNGEPGTWRTIIVNQDGTGSRTLAFASAYKTAAGTAFVASTAASAKDVLSILCVTTSEFFVFSAKGMA